MTKRGSSLSLTIWPGIGQQYFGRAWDHRRLYLTSSSLRVLLWGRCRRDLSTTPPPPGPPCNACDRNYHFIRRFASVRANLSASLRLPFCVRRLIAAPFFAFIVIAGTPVYPSLYPNTTAYRKNRTRGKESSYKKSLYMQDRKRESLARTRRDPLRSFPSSLHDDMEIFSWLVESGTQTLSHFQRIIDLGRGIVIEKYSAFEIPNNVNATARYAIPPGRIN